MTRNSGLASRWSTCPTDPSTSAGAPGVDSTYFGPWDLLVDENHLYVGGRFSTVAGLPRYNFARFTTSLPVPQNTTPPETTIDSGPEGTTGTTGGSATFVFSSSETGSTFECSLDGEAFSQCASPKDYTNLAEGTHTLEVKATDAKGNADTTPLAVPGPVDDATAPSVQSPAQIPYLNATLGTSTVPLRLTWSATDDGGTGVSEYKLQQSTNGGTFANVSLASATATGVTRQLSPGNTYQFRVQAKDQAGNWVSGRRGRSSP
ncbi:MAG: fibronectin type III domain-containing protein [Thermoleophilaceae bacterium]